MRQLAALLLVLVLASSTIVSLFPAHAVSSGHDWAMFQHDPARTGFLPGTNETPAKTWNMSENYPLWASPAVANGFVYIKAEYIECLNASTGITVWSAPTTGNQQEQTSIAVVGGYVYSGRYLYHDFGGDVFALNASTGDRIWTFPTGDFVQSSPAVVEGILYIGSDNGNVYALNASTGTKVWSYLTNGPVRSSPAVAAGCVYVGSGDANVYALDASTGKKLWNYTTGGIGGAPGNPNIQPSPAVADGVVYIGSEDHNVYALNASTGKKIWNYTTGGGVRGSAAIADGRVYIGSNRIFALDALTGAKLWDFPTLGDELSSPAMADDVVYFDSRDNNVYALNASTGAKIGNFTIPHDIYTVLGLTSPAVAYGLVYFCLDHTVYAWEPSAFVNAPGMQSEPFPVGPVAAVVAVVVVVGAGLLLYFKKRKRQPRITRDGN
jgi:outer membrane protein assembly factor BamB